jgi:hypothetical protein
VSAVGVSTSGAPAPPLMVSPLPASVFDSTIVTIWKYEPSAAPGARPSSLNCAAM